MKRYRNVVEYWRDLLDYDPETGVLLWRVSQGTARAGSKAGHIDGRGYVIVTIDSRFYRAHRLIWLLVHGKWPRGEIDHANGDPADNRLCNLRECTRTQNNANRLSKRGGLKGASRHQGRWQAQIQVNCEVRYLGLFDTEQEAHAAYCEAAREHHGEFARLA